jgi:hypothetical protein
LLDRPPPRHLIRDPYEGSKRLIYRGRVLKDASDIRFEKYDIRALLESLDIFAANALRKVVFGAHFLWCRTLNVFHIVGAHALLPHVR